MKDWSAHLDSHWFIVALSRNVTRKPQRVLLFGKPAVLVRGPQGDVLAFEDRCPHRGAALSTGRLDARGLVCPYHGWTFAGGGQCVSMPGGTPDGSPIANFKVPAFRVLERDGFVWLSTASDRDLPERVLALDPSQNRFRWQTRWRAPILDAQENFLDALHTHTVHPGLVRRSDVRRNVDVTLRVGGDGFAIEYAGQATQSGLLFRLFESPRTRECAYFSGLSVGQIEYRYANGSTIWITLYFTPETATSTHVWATLHVHGRWAPRLLVRAFVWPFLRQVARQDQAILEQQQTLREYFPDRHAAVTALDIARPYIARAWGHGGDALPPESRCTLYL
jgi:phenylpropionate dioxygenase-like ring-hydroxylating dioxygenase large terminal subunit